MSYEPLHKPWLPGRGDSHMKEAGMLVVSLKGCKISDFGLTKGVLGKTPLYYSRKGLL